MWQLLIDLQRTIYTEVGVSIRQVSEGAGWAAIASMLPMAIVFGAAHALTPGHSKTLLATYVAGSPIAASRALLTTIVLSFTHVAMAVLIALLSLPLVSLALGNVGRAPELEAVSRGLIAVIGLMMVWRAVGRHRHFELEPGAMGFIAGLVPCPLTLFVMSFAIARGVPQAGVLFAIAMMAGIALTLSAVALAAVFLRGGAVALTGGGQLERLSRWLEGAAGALLVLLAAREIAFG